MVRLSCWPLLSSSSKKVLRLGKIDRQKHHREFAPWQPIINKHGDASLGEAMAVIPRRPRNRNCEREKTPVTALVADLIVGQRRHKR